MTPRACVMGHPVAHSRSPMLHDYWLRTLGIDGSYEFADVAPEDFESFFRNLSRNGFVGGNITRPHKEAAFRLVDRREPAADRIGAVNTVSPTGTNDTHGNGFMYFRDHNISALPTFFRPNDDFDPYFRRYQYGGSIGGPIKKDKAFYFGNVEALRQ